MPSMFAPLNMPLVLAALLVSSGAVAQAHNPDDSWAVIRVVGDTLEVNLEMSTDAAMTLMGVPAGTQPGPENPEDLIAPLTKVAGNIYRFSIGDKMLALQSVVVEPGAEDGVSFHLVYERPATVSGLLKCDACFLAKLPPEHRTALTLIDVRGKVAAGEMLDIDRASAVFEVPEK